MKKHVKVAVTGAGGQIGYALLFRIASGQAFGPNVTVDLHLLEVEAALPALQGLVMELEDCAFPLLRNIVPTADLSVGFKDVDWAILVGAAPRAAGMERADLLAKNGNIFSVQGKALNDYASSDLRVFVVGNPCNTNCLIAMHNAPDVPNDRFFAMTRLDQNRAVAQLAKKANVTVSDVRQMAIWGNHSSTQYPDFYHATIQGQPVPQVITDTQWLTEDFIPLIQQRGAAVIKARGASSAASAANSVVDSIASLVTETPPGEQYSVALCSQGQYGVDKGLIFSFPCRTVQGKVMVVNDIIHNAFGEKKIQETLNELRSERDTVASLKLID